MYLKEIEIIKTSPFIKENIKDKFIEVLNGDNSEDVRIENILDIIILVQEKQEFFNRELNKIREKITEKIILYIDELPPKKELFKIMEKNDEKEEKNEIINNMENLINNNI